MTQSSSSLQVFTRRMNFSSSMEMEYDVMSSVIPATEPEKSVNKKHEQTHMIVIVLITIIITLVFVASLLAVSFCCVKWLKYRRQIRQIDNHIYQPTVENLFAFDSMEMITIDNATDNDSSI
jgi:flagellar basal body-associated protein FliL